MPRTLVLRVSVAIVVAAVASLAARTAHAQQPTSPVRPAASDTVVIVRDSATVADVQRAAEQLSIAVQEAVRKATESPELKVAALKLATNAVKAAQIVVTQQAATLQSMLEALSREVASVGTGTPPAKAKAR